ncbi:hypothetical protein SK128_014151, partial [Halocaridina rubra]
MRSPGWKTLALSRVSLRTVGWKSNFFQGKPENPSDDINDESSNGDDDIKMRSTSVGDRKARLAQIKELGDKRGDPKGDGDWAF